MNLKTEVRFSPMYLRLRESATVSATQRARDLKQAGRDVLVISGGQPDFDTPDHIKSAACEAIWRGETKYTPAGGTQRLKAAVVLKFARDNGIDARLEEIVVAAGAKQLVFNALLATLGEGDEVVIPRPYWVSYPDIVEFAGGRPVFVDCPRDDGFKLRPEALDRAITPATRWFILNSPCNPTGAVYSAAELRAIADVLLRHPHVMILSDDVYEYIVLGDTCFATLVQVEPKLRDRTLIVNGVSKGHCMTGWRIGYGLGPVPLVQALTRLQSQETNGSCSISQAAAEAALTGPLDFVIPHNEAYRRRRDIVVREINRIDGLSCDSPEGALYVYVDASGLIGRRRPDGRPIESDLDIADHLLENGGVAVVPGEGFGFSPYFRTCFAYSDEIMEEACRRIAQAVNNLQDGS